MAYQECLSTKNYNNLTSHPSINGVEIKGDLKGYQLGLGGSGDSFPVGAIIPYMGKIAPPHYLACDGTVYNITDYKTLADFINEQFGSYNFFGGNGTSTFAVPDLRGEFLRGTGTNSHANQGNGAAVGKHQDGTEEYIRFTSYENKVVQNYVRYNTGYPRDTANMDSFYKTGEGYKLDINGSQAQYSELGSDSYTSRPTNTSVLYCIKYEMDAQLERPPVTGFTPCGTIISYYGESAPTHYLPCDGSTYNKFDYPELAAHLLALTNNTPYIVEGDDTKFRVPDLRGEFLRGTGTNSHTNSGSGAGVGVHQSATVSPNIFINSTEKVLLGLQSVPSGYTHATNVDSMFKAGTGSKGYQIELPGSWNSETYNSYTARPTNTSVLYCIATKDIYIDAKYNYSTDEKVVGTWIDGKPLYQKTYVDTIPATTVDGEYMTNQITTSNIDKGWIESGFLIDAVTSDIFNLPVFITNSGYEIKVTMNTDRSILITNGFVRASGSVCYITIRYTKTTD